jgi:hypothetical protein
VSALADLLALEDGPDEPWFIEPRDKFGVAEEARQQEFLRLLPYVAPALNVWAVPNAAKRTRWEVAQAKREGMKSGALDLTITWNHGAAYAEFKNGTEGPTGNQRAMLNTLYRQGHRCGVFRNAETLFAALDEWGAPIDIKVLRGLR